MLIGSFNLPISVKAQQTANYTYTSDESTHDDWKKYFGSDVQTNTENTEYVGRIWTDKSVYNPGSVVYPAEGIEEPVVTSDKNFLIELSTLSTNKSIVGLDYIPLDVVFILDISSSMRDTKNERPVSEMVEATNKAIEQIQSLNYHNRTSLVVYSNKGEEVLPLGRFDKASAGCIEGVEGSCEFVERYKTDSSTYNRNIVIRNGLKFENGQAVPKGSHNNTSGTFI